MFVLHSFLASKLETFFISANTNTFQNCFFSVICVENTFLENNSYRYDYLYCVNKNMFKIEEIDFKILLY